MRAVLLYIALTLFLAFPLSVHPASRVMSTSPDSNLFMWTLAWDTHAFTHAPLGIFDANIYFPERHTLAYSENLIGSALFAAPILWLTNNIVLAMNVVSLLSSVLCGWGAYLLGRRLGMSRAGATMAGLIFAFSPPRFFRLEQLHLTTIQWVPFGLASLHAYLDTGRPRDLHLTVAFFTLQALTSGHGAVFLIVAMLGLVAYRVATGESIAPVKRARDFGLAGVVLLLPTLLMIVPYLSVQREMGLRRSLKNWAASWASFGASPSYFHTWLLAHLGLPWNDRADAYLFPGYIPLVLALAAFVPTTTAVVSGFRLRSRLRRTTVASAEVVSRTRVRDSLIFYALLTLLSVWLSIGPPLGLWPLVYWLPGLNFIRVPSRFILLAILGVAVLGGFGFDRLTARFTARTRAAFAIALALLLAAEFAAPLDTEAYSVDPPAIDRWLNTQPKPFVVAEAPLANPRNLGSWERRHTTYMLHSTAHWQKTVEGYSGLRPPLHERLYERLSAFPDEDSIRAIAELGVTYLVVHSDYYGPEEWQGVEAKLSQLGDYLTLAHVEGEGRVYLVRRSGPPRRMSAQEGER